MLILGIAQEYVGRPASDDIARVTASSIAPEGVIAIVADPEIESAVARLVRVAEDMQGLDGGAKKNYVVERLDGIVRAQVGATVDRSVLHLLNELGVVAMKHQRGELR